MSLKMQEFAVCADSPARLRDKLRTHLRELEREETILRKAQRVNTLALLLGLTVGLICFLLHRYGLWTLSFFFWTVIISVNTTSNLLCVYTISRYMRARRHNHTTMQYIEQVIEHTKVMDARMAGAERAYADTVPEAGRKAEEET